MQRALRLLYISANRCHESTESTGIQDYGSGWASAARTIETEECAKILIRNACVTYFPSQVLGDQKVFDGVWREAVRRTHPDTKNGCDGDDFRNVINAREQIKTLKGWQ
jgi:hypothetical protein